MDYERWIEDSAGYRQYLDEQIAQHPKLFYMIGTSEEVEKGLYLRRYGVPYEGIAHVLGHTPMYWYNATKVLDCFVALCEVVHSH